MSYTLKSNSNKIIAIYNIFDKEKIYQDAKNYLLVQFQKEKKLQNKLDKLTFQYENYWDFECDQLQEKINNIQNKVILYDIFNRINAIYILEQNIEENIIVKVKWKN